MDEMFTRVAFCPKCYQNSRPQQNQRFLVYGSHQNKEHVKIAMKKGIRGYTPHIIKFIKMLNGDVVYNSICGMNGCGYTIYEVNGKMHHKEQSAEWKFGIITEEQWKAWKLFRGITGYEI